MNGKLSCWTVTWINNDGVHNMYEPETKEDVYEFLKELETGDQDMNYVQVFPPYTNLTYDELERFNN